MKASEHGEHLIKLTRQGWMNCYLVREDDGLTVIDTTLGGAAKDIIRAAEVAGAPIARITLTHGHGDHAGSFDELAELVDVAEVVLPAREARFMRGDRTVAPEEGRARPKTIAIRKTKPHREVGPGDRVGSLEVVAAPGHTLGHVAFLDTRDRTLIAGDTYATLGGTSVTSQVKWPFPLAGMATWDRPLALQTGRDLRALAPARLAVGHGKVLEDPLEAMDRAIARAS